MGNDNSHESDSIHKAKIIVVGDYMDGLKTQWLMSYVNEGKPTDPANTPTVFDNYSADIKYKGAKINISLWDTTGQEDHEKLRALTYPQTDAVIMLYNRLDAKSLTNIKNTWVHDLMLNIPIAPIILVECEGEDKGTHVTEKQADEAKDNYYFMPYCVEKTNLNDWKGIKKVIEKRAIEAIEFTRTLGLEAEFARIYEEFVGSFADSKVELKQEAEEAEKSGDHETAKSKREQLERIEQHVRDKRAEHCQHRKYRIYADKLGWKFVAHGFLDM